MMSLEKSVSRAFPVSVQERFTRPDAVHQPVESALAGSDSGLAWLAPVLAHWSMGGMSSTFRAPRSLQILLVVLILRLPWHER